MMKEHSDELTDILIGKSILVVDDEHETTDSLVENLRDLNKCLAFPAYSGQEALRLIRKKGRAYFDGVLLDIWMEERDTGLKILPEIREIDPEIPIVILSGYDNVENTIGALQKGADDFLVKDVDHDEIVLRLSMAISQKKQQIQRFKLEQFKRNSRIISHKLRNDLFAVAAGIEYVVSYPNEEGSEKRLRGALQRIRQADIYIQEMYRESAGIIKTPANLTTVSMQAKDWFRTLPENDKITLNIDIEPGIPSLDIDERMLKYVLEVIIQNAYDAVKTYRKDDTGRIDVLAKSVIGGEPEESKFAEINILDNGGGISRENQGKLFAPGFTTKTGGTGMGLYLARDVIEQCQGRIDFKSEAGGGTKFVICLQYYE